MQFIDKASSFGKFLKPIYKINQKKWSFFLKVTVNNLGGKTQTLTSSYGFNRVENSKYSSNN